MNRLPAAVAVIVALAAATTALAAGQRPHIIEFQYSQDYEGLGRHYTVGATIKGDADRVSVKGPGGRTKARLSGHIQPSGRDNHFWIVEKRGWIKELRADLKADGGATVRVKAVAGGTAVRKRCDLVFEPDPQFGDFAGGECRRVR